MIEKGALYSVISGMCAAGGSVFGKLVSTEDGSSILSCIIKVFYISLMISSNAAVWLFFVKALNSSESSLSATVTSSAVNFCCSALLGWLIFNESCGFLWWLGSSLVLSGIVLINRSAPPPPPPPPSKQKVH